MLMEDVSRKPTNHSEDGELSEMEKGMEKTNMFS